MNETLAMKLITEFYGEDKAERTGIPYIQHIHEGVKILEELNADEHIIDAYCLHPIYQMLDNPDDHPLIVEYGANLDEHTVKLAKEYKKTANAYLCKPHYRSADDKIMLSPYSEVNVMLVADKVQNRKDFETHYEPQENKEVFARSNNLAQYFRNWLQVLGVTEKEYERLKAIIA